MGSSDEMPDEQHGAAALGHLARAVSRVVDEILASEQPTAVGIDDLRLLVSTAIRLYGGISSLLAEDVDPLDGDVTQADTMAMACALLKSHQLSPLDLSVWFAEKHGVAEADRKPMPDDNRSRMPSARLEHPVGVIFDES